jgi:Zn-dependent M28 family amino/carboxypeptidase
MWMRVSLLLVVLLSSCAAAAPRVEEGAPQAKAAVSPAPSSSKIDSAQLLEDVRVLSGDAMEGRAAGTPGAARARSHLQGRFTRAGLKPLFGQTFEQSFSLGGRAEGEGVNLVGHVAGRRQPARLVVVTAHYDHLGVKNGQVYNGADDNASGVAALLQLAAHFTREPPAHTMVFAALDAEEIGLLGASALVEALRKEGREVALNVNLDMVGHSERGELYAAGAHHTPALRPILEKVAAAARVKLLLGHDRPELGHGDWTRQSDHFAFHREKIPFVYFGVEDHKDYHRPSDDFETLTADFYVRAAETILDALRSLDENLN